MEPVIIVSRTRMRNGVCCGGFNLNTGEFVRLHNERGAKLPESAPYQVGQIYDLEYTRAWNCRCAPHTEDKQVMNAIHRRNTTLPELVNYIKDCCPINHSDLRYTFNGCLQFIGSGYAPFVGKDRVPNNSVCFWQTDAPLVKCEFMGKVRYSYKNAYISYVGCQTPINHIPAGTLVRLSLANWWSSNPSTPERCYLQVSGWYIT